MTQNEHIKQWLLQGHPITAASALARFGCARLAARINDLKNSGMEITAQVVTRQGKHRKVLNKAHTLVQTVTRSRRGIVMERDVNMDDAKLATGKYIRCWSCDRVISLKSRINADGNCPKCGQEIELNPDGVSNG